MLDTNVPAQSPKTDDSNISKRFQLVLDIWAYRKGKAIYEKEDAFAAKAARTRSGFDGSGEDALTGDFFSPPLFRDVAWGSSRTTGVFGL